MKAVDGDIHIKIAGDLAVDVKTQSIDGDIRIDLPLDRQVSTAGQVVGSRNGGGDNITIRTVDGDIHVN